MSAAGATAAASFASLMAKKNAVESTKNLLNSQKAINDNQALGAYDGLSNTMREMQKASVNSVPFRLAMAEFNAGTMESRLALMEANLKLLANPVVGRSMELGIDLINTLVDGVTKLSTKVDELLDRIDDLRVDYQGRPSPTSVADPRVRRPGTGPFRPGDFGQF
jgi:hypothetical protein